MQMQRENELLRGMLKAKSGEVKRLRAALRALAPDSDSCDESSDDNEQFEVLEAFEEEGNETEEEQYSEDELEPAWDTDGFYRCGKCSWEIIEGWCQKCVRKYPQLYEQDVAHPESYSQTSLPGDDTYYDARRSYLTSEPRGTTPSVEVDRVLLRPDTIALGFEDRLEEYEALLARGATRLMCETFKLEFSHELGILLEMDEELMAEWANEDMHRFGPRWKVCFGREIHLDPKDVDGSTYIEEHLEEALLFGKRTEGGLRWESVSPGLGFMLTRPVKNSNDTDDGMNSETEMEMEYPGEITRNEYEEPSDDSECDSEIDADDRQMQASVDETWQADADIIMQDTTSDISDSSSSASSEYDFEDDDEDEDTTAGTGDAIQAAV